jgi:hypothetical protein
MSGPAFRASDLQDPQRQRAARADAQMTPQVDQSVGSALLARNETWAHYQQMARYPRWPGDPMPGQKAAPPPVDTTAEQAVPLVDHGERLAAQPTPFVADETILRTQLTDLLREQAQTEQALDYAAGAHERSRHHLAQMQKRHADYIGLDMEIAASTAETLKSGVPMPDYTARRLDRNDAVAALQAATEAEALLLKEHGEAAGAAASARTAVTTAIHQLLACHGEALAVARKAMLAEAEVRLIELRALAQSIRVQLGPEMRGVLIEDARVAGFHRHDTSAWTTLAEKLQADPQAPLTLD